MTLSTQPDSVRRTGTTGLRGRAVWLFAALVGAGYAGIAALSLSLINPAHGIAVLWPAAGVAAGALIVARPGARMPVVAAVALAVLATNLWFGAGLARSLAFAGVNTLEAVLCAAIFLRMNSGLRQIRRPGDVLALTVAGVLSTAGAAGAGAVLLSWTGLPAILSVEGWGRWMRADLVGILTVAPVFLVRWTADDRQGRVAVDRVLDGVAILGAALGTWVLLAVPALQGSALHDVPLATVMPAILWIGIRRSVPAAAWAALAVAGVATLTVIGGTGVFADAARLSDPVGAAQMFMAACSLSLLTLATIFHERQRSRTLLGAAEERRQIAVEGAGAASWDIDLATGEGVWSPAHFAFLGLTPPPDHKGSRANWRARVHPADLPRVDAAFEASLDGRTPYEAEYRITRADTGEERWLSGYGRILPDAEGRPARSVGILLDVTARHDGKRTDAFLLRLEDALRGLSSAAEVERTAATMLGREIGAGRVFYACIESQRFGTVGPNYVDGMAPIEGRFDVMALSAAVLDAHLRGETVAIADVATYPGLDDGELAAFAQIGVRSAVTANLRKNGRWVASFSAQRPDAHDWTSGERALVEAVAERTWTAVERVHAERALAASEARFRALFDEARVGMVLMDKDYRLRQWNATYARIVGREGVDLTGADPLSFTHPDDVAMQRSMIAAMRTSNERGTVFEKRYMPPGAAPIWVRANVTLLAGGEALGIIEDVSDRVAAEADARLVADAVPAFVYRSGPDGGTTYANRRWIDYTGLSLAASLGAGSIAAVHPDDRARVEREYHRAIETRTTLATEFRCRRHDGAYRWFYTVSEPEIGPDGAITGWFGTSTDVNDRKMAEAERATRDRRDGFLLRLQDRMRLLDEPAEISAIAAEMLGLEMGAGRVLFGMLDEAANTGSVDRNWLDGMPDATGAYPLSDFGAALDTLRSGQQMVVDDVAEDARTARHCARPELAPLRIAATLDTPLMRDGRLVGLLAIQSPAPRVWTAEEIALAKEVAERSWAVMERLRVQADLRVKTEELESLVANAPLGVAFFDRDHRYLRINDELAEINGSTVAAHIGRTIHEIIPVSAPYVVPHLDRVFATRETVRDIEVTGETPAAPGVTRTWLTNYYPVPNSDGGVGQVGVWVVDITARKAAEQALRDSEARLRAVIEAVPVGLLFAEAPSGRILGGNALVERILGHPILPSRGVSDYREWVSFHPDGRQVEAEEYPLALALHGAERPELEVHYQRGDGRRTWINFVAAPIRDANGAIVGGVVASIDVDRERGIETELRELNADLERRVAEAVAQHEGALNQLHEAQKMEAIGQLTGGVAHDFNNLLAAILSNLDLLRKRAVDDRSVQLIEGATRGAERGAALTKRLLAFARRQDLTAERVVVGDLVAGMHDLLERSLGPAIPIEVRIPPDLPPVSVDPNQLELALLNLAVNARDAMPDGGMLTITAGAWDRPVGTPGADNVWIRVADSGSGMDADTLRRATEPFFTTKGVGKGTGLGLSMVQGLAAQSGGTIRIESQPGQGTTIELWLPRATEAAVAAVPPPPVEPPVTADDPGAGAIPRPLRILVVDDDILVAMGTTAMLEDLGHDVIEANSGARALELIADTPDLDLMITDHAMPGMTGAELARHVRKLRPAMPIVLATGYAELPDGEDAVLPRLAKPFRQSELEAVLNRVLRQA